MWKGIFPCGKSCFTNGKKCCKISIVPYFNPKINDRRVFLLYSESKSIKHRIVSRLGSAALAAAVIGTGLVGMGGSVYAYNAYDTAPIAAASAASVDYGLAKTSQEGVTLHCWNWSYNNIRKYMKDIAAAGFTSIQTSPVQQPKDYYWEGVAYGNVGIPNGTGGEDGNWWKLYQPVTFSICDNGYSWLGTKSEFKAMCDEAEKYGVRVIVDIVANHMGNIQGYKIGQKGASLADNQKAVMSDISPQVGEFWKKDMLTDPSYWHISTSWTHSSDGRFDVTQGNMGMPDLNTGDKKVQQMVLNLLKECIDCGADGFRFDAAKHIETPKDNASFASDFWDVVLDGARAYYKQKNGYDGVYFYGEVLNRIDDSNAENYYLSKMSLTDNSTSDNLRNSVMHGHVDALAASGFNGYIHGQGNRAVLWPESHDTYMGGGSSYDANDTVIKQVWAIIASRKDSTGLFFARPYYSKDILAGDVSKARQSTADIMKNIDEQTQIGDVGTITWADPAVVAANRFRNFFVGQSEKLGASGNIAYNLRGKTGIVIVRGGGPGAVSLSVGMQDGTYYDQVTGEKFTVSGGVVKGNVKNADGIAVVYNPKKDYGKVSPQEPTAVRISAESATGSNVFNTDSVNVNIKVTGAAKVKYTTSEGASGSFTGTKKTITLGTYTATGEDVTLTVEGTASDGISKSKTYTFTKKVESSEYPTLRKGGAVFDNSLYGWQKVYCYAYDDSGSSVISNASWPGEPMNNEGGDYWSYEYPDKFTGTVKLIFNNDSGVQVPDSGAPGFEVSASRKILFKQTISDLPASVKSLSVKLTPSVTKAVAGQTVKLTAAASNAKGTVKYTFMVNDGTTIKSASTSNSCTWTPAKAGTYILAVKANDSSLGITATAKVVVSSAGKLTSTSKVSKTSVSVGDTVQLNASAVGGTSPYTYGFYYKKAADTVYRTIKGYSTTASASFMPTAAGKYNVLIKVKDKKGAIAKSVFTITAVKVPELKCTGTLSSASIGLGNSVTVKAAASGGTSPYKYAFYYKAKSASVYTKLKGYSTTSSVVFKPSKMGYYNVLVKASDKAGKVARSELLLKVGTVNTGVWADFSSTTVKLGNPVKLTCSATGRTAPYQFAVYFKKSVSSQWTTAQSYKSNRVVTITPKAATTYNILVKAKDSQGTVLRKTYTIRVTK